MKHFWIAAIAMIFHLQPAWAVSCERLSREVKAYKAILTTQNTEVVRLSALIKSEEENLVQETIFKSPEIKGQRKSIQRAIRNIKNSSKILNEISQHLLQVFRTQSTLREFNLSLKESIRLNPQIKLSEQLRAVLKVHRTALNPEIISSLNLLLDFLVESEDTSDTWMQEASVLISQVSEDREPVFERLLESAMRDRQNMLESLEDLKQMENKLGLEDREVEARIKTAKLNLDSYTISINDARTAYIAAAAFVETNSKTLERCNLSQSTHDRDWNIKH